jgi:FdhD protein
MAENSRCYSIVKMTDGVKQDVEASIVVEYSLSIRVNGMEMAVLSCSPTDVEYLAVGFARSQGFIDRKSDIKDIVIGEASVDILTNSETAVSPGMMVTSSNGRSSRLLNAPTMKCESSLTVRSGDVYRLMESFEEYSRNFVKTGGVHSAALCERDRMVLFNEDIGRHNAIDKVFGRCLLEERNVEELLLVTSGRVSSDIMMKAAIRRVPVVISRNSPTDLGVEIADKTGITLLGFVRGNNMNAYTHAWRVV